MRHESKPVHSGLRPRTAARAGQAHPSHIHSRHKTHAQAHMLWSRRLAGKLEHSACTRRDGSGLLCLERTLSLGALSLLLAQREGEFLCLTLLLLELGG